MFLLFECVNAWETTATFAESKENRMVAPPVLTHPCAEFLVAVFLVEEVVGRVRLERLLTDVC